MEHSPLPWVVRETATGGIVIVDASNEQVAILCQLDFSSAEDNRAANSTILIDSVNRQVTISDKEVQEIKVKNLQHRQLRFSKDLHLRINIHRPAPALAVMLEETIWQVDKLLMCVEQLNIIIEEILRDKGVLDQAAIPILQVREDNVQMKDTLVKILDIYEGGPSSYIERAENMADLAYKAIGRQPQLGTRTGWVGTEIEDDEDDYTSIDPH